MGCATAENPPLISGSSLRFPPPSGTSYFSTRLACRDHTSALNNMLFSPSLIRYCTCAALCNSWFHWSFPCAAHSDTLQTVSSPRQLLFLLFLKFCSTHPNFAKIEPIIILKDVRTVWLPQPTSNENCQLPREGGAPTPPIIVLVHNTVLCVRCSETTQASEALA